MTKRVILLGATGSIGKSTVEVAERFKDHFRIVALSAHGKEEELLSLADRLGVSELALSGKKPSSPRIKYSGSKGLVSLIEETGADYVVNAVSGAAGFLPSVAAIGAGKKLALANKETLVMAGSYVKRLAEEKGVPILPVDSEHSAVFLMYHRFGADQVENVILTASGGAFRDLPKEELDHVTPMDALKHPTWSMGEKITIDSASLANKGLEVIEAHHLFDMPADRIKVLVHPQSYVHSIIETREGSLYAQIGRPDMKTPILNALTFPDAVENPSGRFSLAGMSLTFAEPDPEKYPMLALAYDSLRAGGACPLVYNAANEVAVAAFVRGQICFPGIGALVEKTLASRPWTEDPDSVEAVLEIDAEARSVAEALLPSSGRR